MIQVEKDGGVVIRAPSSLSVNSLEKFIQGKQTWIRNAVERQKKHHLKTSLSIRDGGRLLYLGELRPVVSDSGVRDAYYQEGTYYIPTLSEEENRQSVISLLRKTAKRTFTRRVKYFSCLAGIRYSSIRITGAATRWGSCNAKGGMNFSYRLLFTPPETIDYVIVHELSHILQHNHSEAFWKVVENIMPDYRRRARALRNFEKEYDFSV
ncbi:MAG TPA: SprT family zinc-dependent metalloprotease [Clostridia bacterium]|nr:SprT family zinc-dependent metalloprotease [Clostridia bacterium]